MSERAGSTRTRLSREAARLFAERGYHGTSISDLAEAVKVQKSSVYTHISGKHDLLAEVATAGAEAFHRALDDLPAEASPAERLRLALRGHLDVVHCQLDVATVWLQEWRFLDGKVRDRFLSERRRYRKRISEMFEAARDAGELRADLDVRYATLAFLSCANWAHTWVNHETDTQEVADSFWEILFAGMAASPGKTGASRNPVRRTYNSAAEPSAAMTRRRRQATPEGR